MITRTVYLAGGISGLTVKEAWEWRERVASLFPNWLIPISPLRGKDYLKEKIGSGVVANHYGDEMGLLATSKGITHRDRNDVKRADALLINLLRAKRISIGTVMEIAWGDLYRKPMILVMENRGLHDHPMIRESVGWITDSLDIAATLVVDILRTGH